MIPEWLLTRQVDEKAFEAAYDQALPRERALIKTAIATLYAWLEPRGVFRRRTEEEKGQGLCVSTRIDPRKWGVVHIPAHCCDPALVVGAVLPIIAGGVWPLVVILEDESPHQQQAILALELCGVETVYTMPSALMQQTLEHWLQGKSNGPGMVVCIDHAPAPSCGQTNVSTWGHMLVNLPRPQRAGVWLLEEEIDLFALSFMHPGLECVVWSGGERELPPGFSKSNAEWSDFLHQQADVVWVPASLVDQALSAFFLVLGPGLEPVWIWPWYVSVLAEHICLGIVPGKELERKGIEEML